MSRYLISDLHSPVFSLLQHVHCIQTATNTATATYIFTATTRYSYTASLQLIQLIAIATPTLNRRTPVQTPFSTSRPTMPCKLRLIPLALEQFQTRMFRLQWHSLHHLPIRHVWANYIVECWTGGRGELFTYTLPNAAGTGTQVHWYTDKLVAVE